MYVLCILTTHPNDLRHDALFSPRTGYEYYLSDNSGFSITKDGNIVLHKRDGSPESHRWTLSNWLRVCGVRYQSRARLFCIQKRTDMALIQWNLVKVNSWGLSQNFTLTGVS